MAAWDLSDVVDGQLVKADHIKNASNNWQGDVNANNNDLYNVAHLNLVEATEPASPATGHIVVYGDIADDSVKFKKHDGTVVGIVTSGVGGDLSGSLPNPTVAKINGAVLGTTTATDKHILVADGTDWDSVAVSGDATISNLGVVSVDKIKGATLGTTTATDKNILVADGTDWDSVAVSGDATIANTGAVTLATVNSNVGTFGDSSDVAQVTVDAKGRITAVSAVPISAGAGLPSQTGNAGKFLDTNGSVAAWAAVASTGTLTLPTYIVYKGAVSQNNAATLALNSPASTPAVAQDSGDTNNILGLARFKNGEADSVQDWLYIPSDQSGALDIEIIWRSVATSGNVQWNVSTAFAAHSAAIFDQTFNAAQTVTTTVQGTTKQSNSSVISTLTTTGISTGGVMFWKISRTNGGSDTMADNADVLAVIVTVRRALSISVST